MKGTAMRFILPILFMFFVAPIFAADPLPGGASQVFVTWDPVTKRLDGSPCTPTGYEVAILAAGKDPNTAAAADFLTKQVFASAGMKDLSTMFAGKAALIYTVAVRTVADTQMSSWVAIQVYFAAPAPPVGLKATVITTTTTTTVTQ